MGGNQIQFESISPGRVLWLKSIQETTEAERAAFVEGFVPQLLNHPVLVHEVYAESEEVSIFIVSSAPGVRHVMQ